MVKTKLHTGAPAHVVRFSSDLALPWQQVLEYYCLRFQIEFNFRDATQCKGLGRFHEHPSHRRDQCRQSLPVHGESVLSLLQDLRQTQPACSVLDLKAHSRGAKYVEETRKMLPEPPEPIVVARIFAKVASLGRIHTPPPESLAS